MSKIEFVVDKEKCIHCGLCTKDCICSAISMDDEKTPKMENPDFCIKCQHCFMICPTGAISILGKNPEESDKIYVQNSDMILNLIKSRRSDRQYKQQNISKENMEKLKNMLSYTPKGCNYDSLRFSIIDNIDVMNEFRQHTNKKIVDALTITPIKAVAEKFAMFKKFLLNGEDVIFRNAPHMIVVSSSVKAPCPKEDAIIALSYFELYAQSLGIGTCWCGLAQSCLMLYPELCEYIGIEDKYQPSYVMLFGDKEVNYQRTPQPQPAKINIVESKEFKKLSPIQAVKRFFWNLIR